VRLITQFCRFIYIVVVLLRFGLDKLLWASTASRRFNKLLFFFPWRWFRKPALPDGGSIRLALETLGPLFVKFGQMLSTRRDILPDEIADELAKLQDDVPPFPGALAKAMIEKSLNQPITALFESFESTPLASASISQVHAATLQNGALVVVKVLRPGIEKKICCDIGLLEILAKLILRFHPLAQRFHPVEVVAEIKNTLLDELDLLREAANASQLKRNFEQSDSLHVPLIYWHYSRKDILVMERVKGIAISNVTALKAHGVDLKRLAERGVEIFFTQVFRDCFFHADMHPGNIFVALQNPQNPTYIAVDFGIMGTLGPDDQHYLGENFLAFFKRDYRRVAELHVQSGWVPPHTRVESFESAIRSVCEPIFERPLKEISFGQTLLRLFQTARRFEMQVQPQLLLLQKTLLSIEGLGRQLYPDLDLWRTAKPFLEKWMKRHYGPRAFFERLRHKLPLWQDKLWDLPEAIYDVLHLYQQQSHYARYATRYPVKTPPKRQDVYLRLLGIALVVAATFGVVGGRVLPLWGAGIGIAGSWLIIRR